jgi:hypothetical protein
MLDMRFAWQTALYIFAILSFKQALNDQPSSLEVEKHIVGTWYLESQEMLINGKEIHAHFDDLAAHLSASSAYEIDPQTLAKKFKEGFNGIPSGTVFTFYDNYSYQIEIPAKPTQRGMWRIKNQTNLLLQAKNHEMLLLIRDLEPDNAVFSIREAKVDSQLGAGGYTVMELVLNLGR